MTFKMLPVESSSGGEGGGDVEIDGRMFFRRGEESSTLFQSKVSSKDVGGG